MRDAVAVLMGEWVLGWHARAEKIAFGTSPLNARTAPTSSNWVSLLDFGFYHFTSVYERNFVVRVDDFAPRLDIGEWPKN